MNPQRAAALAEVALLDFQVVNLPSPQPLQPFRGGLEIRCVREALHRLALELLGIEAEHGAEGPIAVAVAALTVRESDADRRTFYRIAEQRLYVPERRFPQQSFHTLLREASTGAFHRLRPMQIQTALHSRPTRSSHWDSSRDT